MHHRVVALSSESRPGVHVILPHRAFGSEMRSPLLILGLRMLAYKCWPPRALNGPFEMPIHVYLHMYLGSVEHS